MEEIAYGKRVLPSTFDLKLLLAFPALCKPTAAGQIGSDQTNQRSVMHILLMQDVAEGSH